MGIPSGLKLGNVKVEKNRRYYHRDYYNVYMKVASFIVESLHWSCIFELNVGDIVVFEHDNHLLVKRIAAGPGDTIEHKGVVRSVPDECFYLLGDNAEASCDARYWDDPFVARQRIIARVLLCRRS